MIGHEQQSRTTYLSVFAVDESVSLLVPAGGFAVASHVDVCTCMYVGSHTRRRRRKDLAMAGYYDASGREEANSSLDGESLKR
ncbi:hypothetical protein CI102_12506 [Trichoderma harzianum]|nr:hypothetical protein CI102_12506 [Trichoderma harzianum]